MIGRSITHAIVIDRGWWLLLCRCCCMSAPWSKRNGRLTVLLLYAYLFSDSPVHLRRTGERGSVSLIFVIFMRTWPCKPFTYHTILKGIITKTELNLLWVRLFCVLCVSNYNTVWLTYSQNFACVTIQRSAGTYAYFLSFERCRNSVDR